MMLNSSMEDYVRMVLDRRNGMFDTLIFKFMQSTGAKPEDIMLVEELTDTGYRFYYAKKKKADVAYPPDKTALLASIGSLLERRIEGSDSVLLFMLTAIFPINKKTRLLFVQDGTVRYKVAVYQPVEPLLAYSLEAGRKNDRPLYKEEEVVLSESAGKCRIGYSEDANLVLVSRFDL